MDEKKLGVNPWLRIWVKPRDTIRKIIDFNPKFRFLWLSFLYGLPMLLHTAQNMSLAEQFTTFGIVIAALVLAIFVGMLGISIATLLVFWTGKWIGGKGNYLQVRAAVSWSNAPNLIAVLIWAILIGVFQSEVFVDTFDQLNFAGPEFMVASVGMFIQAIVSIWSFIILIKGLGEAQGFSAWKGLLNVLIPFFLVGIFIWLVTWLFWLVNGMPSAAA